MSPVNYCRESADRLVPFISSEKLDKLVLVSFRSCSKASSLQLEKFRNIQIERERERGKGEKEKEKVK